MATKVYHTLAVTGQEQPTCPRKYIFASLEHFKALSRLLCPASGFAVQGRSDQLEQRNIIVAGVVENVLREDEEARGFPLPGEK